MPVHPASRPDEYTLYYPAEIELADLTNSVIERVDATRVGKSAIAAQSHLTELHGGTVTVSSAGRGRGARFEVRLPAIRAAVEPAPAHRLTSGASRWTGASF